MTDLTAPHFHDESKAREHLEGVRWPNGPECPHCGHIGRAYPITGEKVRKGTYTCPECRKQFSVTVGTLFESSHIGLHKWLLAVHLLSSSKKGFSSAQLSRNLGVTYKTAWFMSHRIRESMKDPVYSAPLGGNGRTVEADETYWGNKGKQRKGARGSAHKEKIFSLVERGGKVHSFHVQSVAGKTLKPIMRAQIDRESAIMTDEFGAYKGVGEHFRSHETVNHSAGEYVRGQIHTQTIDNYFSIMKRGLRGVYQHVGAGHLKRYIGEFDFRYNHRDICDHDRACVALRGIVGKRLMYTRP